MSRSLFISDLHLAAERPATNDAFFRFLEETAGGAQGLYILGDLFEYWLGDDELDPGGDPLAAQAAAGLKRLSDAGTPVILMHGNRDFLLASRFCAAAGAMLVSDPIVMQVGGERVLLMHGDTLCTDDTKYQRFRSEVRSQEWQKRFLAQPLALRKQQAEAARRASESEKQLKRSEEHTSELQSH